MILASCASTKTVPLETLRHDTLYINKEKYDSIYIDNSHLIDRGGDTIVIKDTKTEYRFRFLRDTIRITKRDSIPYEVRITEVKEVKYIPPWCKCIGTIGGVVSLLLIIHALCKLKL